LWHDANFSAQPLARHHFVTAACKTAATVGWARPHDSLFVECEEIGQLGAVFGRTRKDDKAGTIIPDCHHRPVSVWLSTVATEHESSLVADMNKAVCLAGLDDGIR